MRTLFQKNETCQQRKTSCNVLFHSKKSRKLIMWFWNTCRSKNESSILVIAPNAVGKKRECILKGPYKRNII